MDSQTPVAVLGGGSFGTVLANLMAEKGIPVRLWMRNAEAVGEINERRTNHHYLPGVTLADSLMATCELADALTGVDVVFVAIPSSGFRDVVRQAAPLLTPEQMLVSTTKGIEAGSFCLMSQIIEQECPAAAFGVLSGPNLAKEIARKQLTATVIASAVESVRDKVQAL